MKGFLLIGYNNNISSEVDFENLETDIISRSLMFDRANPICRLYDNLSCYQLFDNVADKKIINDKVYIEGNVYGKFSSFNKNKLEYSSAIHLISKTNIIDNHELFEGSVSICSVNERKIIFQNDLEGYRKIFYFIDQNKLIITNYLPLIFKVLNQKWVLRKNAVISYLCGRESKWPLTFIENIKVLPPLSRAEISESGISIISKSFSDLYNIELISKENLRADLYKQYVNLALKASEGKIAVTLSGGYDSNCLTKLYHNINLKNFTAVSLGYKSQRERDKNIYDETIYAEKIAESLNIPFKKYVLNKDEFFGYLDEFVSAIDQPAHDPSSTFILNHLLKKDGFDTVVNGMGGDANFADKSSLKLALNLFTYSKALGGLNIIYFIAKKFSFKGPFRYFQVLNLTKDKPQSFHDLFERVQIFKSSVCGFINDKVKVAIDEERNLRRVYFDNLYTKAKTRQELFYSLAIFSSPDEYHAALMANRTKMNIAMPFVSTKAALTVMNGSAFHKINNRDFETSIFGGIEEELLAKRKSGLSIPYSEWMKEQAFNVFSFYCKANYFTKDDFNFEEFRFKYENDLSYSNSLEANSTIWKLLIVQKYIQKYSLSF